MEGNQAIYQLEANITQLREEKIKWPLGSPQRERILDELRELKSVLREESKYRTEQDKLTIDYSKYVRTYNTIEEIERELANPSLTASRRSRLTAKKDDAYTKLESTEPGEGITVSSLDELKDKIEDVAFKRNELNGVVDPEILKRDKKELEKIEKCNNYRKLQYNLNRLAREIKLLKTLMDELSALPDPSSERDAKLREIEAQKGVINNVGTKIKDLSTILDIKDATFDYDNPDKIKGEDIDKAKDEVKTAKKLVFDELGKMRKDIKKNVDLGRRKKEILEKYGISDIKKYDKNPEILNDKVIEIKSNYVPGRVMRTMSEDRRITREESASMPDSSLDEEVPETSSPRGTGSGTPLTPPSRPSMAGVASRSNPPTFSGTRGVGTPTPPPAGRSTAGGIPEAGTATRGATRSDVNLPVPSPGYIPRTQVLYEQPIGYNLLEQVEEPGKQRIENGRIYRFQREDDKLVYLSEDIEQYTSKPEKQLRKEMRNIRKRIKSELGKEEFRRLYEELKGQDSILSDFMSANPFTRRGAANDIVDDIKDNAGNTGHVQMLLALKSSVLPSQIESVLKSTKEPYPYESDLILIQEKGKLGIRSNVKMYAEPELMKMRRKYNTKNRTINEEHYTTDGVLRPFSIDVSEETSRRSRRDPSRNSSGIDV